MKSPLGSIPTDWGIACLGDITQKIGSGATPIGGEKVYLPSRHRYALIRSQAVHDYHLDLSALSYITDDDALRLANAEVRAGDVLLNITGDGVTFARASSVPPEALPACVNQHVSIIRANSDKLDPGFLLCYLTHPDVKAYIESFNAGGSRRAITKGHIESFVVPLPSLSEQKGISSLFESINAKIEQNQRVNVTLDAMCLALFRDWFVEFGPVRAKSSGLAAYLDDSIWGLFPDDFGEKGLPNSWTSKPMDETADFLNGLALQKFPPENDEVLPVIKIAQLRQGVTSRSDLASSEIPAPYVVQDGDLLFSWSGSLTHIIWTGGRGALNQHLFKVTSEEYPQWFIFYWIGEHMPNFQAIAASKATTMGHIQRHHLHEARVVVAGDRIMTAADQVIGPLFARHITNKLENRKLADLRKFLLPKLVSGEIRLHEAEKKVEDAL